MGSLTEPSEDADGPLTDNTNTTYIYTVMDDKTFYSILFGTSLCLLLLFTACLIVACLKIRHDLYKSIPFNVQRVMQVTHINMARSSPAVRRLRPQATFGRENVKNS